MGGARKKRKRDVLRKTYKSYHGVLDPIWVSQVLAPILNISILASVPPRVFFFFFLPIAFS